MKFLGLSALSNDELAILSHEMVDTHGAAARDVVNRLIDEANAANAATEHAKWMEVAYGVMQILRPHQFPIR